MNLKEYRHKDVTYKEGSLSIILSPDKGMTDFYRRLRIKIMPDEE